MQCPPPPENGHPVRILLVSPYDWSVPGGVNSCTYHIYKGLKDRRHEVRILSPASRPVDLPDHVAAGAIYPIRSNGTVARVTLDPRAARFVRRFLAGFRPDLVHLQEPLCPYLNWIVAENADCPVVGTFHSYSESRRLYRLFSGFLQRYWNKLDKRICVSQAARDHIASHFPGEYVIVPNGIDLTRYEALPARSRRERKGRHRILFVGRFDEPRKGLRHLLEALPQLDGCELIVVGDGDRARFGRRADNPLIRWEGPLGDDELVKVMGGCDLFVAPSTGGESFGIVLLEAMAAGLPVVAADIPGYRSVVRHEENGVLVAPANPAALVAGITALLSDPARCDRLTERGRATAVLHDWDIIVERLVAIYDLSNRADHHPGAVGRASPEIRRISED